MRRRQFTRTVALWAGGVVIFSYAGIPVVHHFLRADVSPGSLSRDFFEAHIGKVFILGQEKARALLLMGVENAVKSESREQFHAIFEVSPGTPLEEGIYQLQRNSIVQFGLFLTRANTSNSRQRLIATINLQPAA